MRETLRNKEKKKETLFLLLLGSTVEVILGFTQVSS